MEKQSPGFWRAAAVMAACGLLLGCGGEGGDADDVTSDTSSHRTSTAADPTPAPSVALKAGDPWKVAQDYLATLHFVTHDTAKHVQLARVCTACEATSVRIEPEHRARYLERAHFGAGQRVIARIYLLGNEHVPDLGSTSQNKERRAWLLTTTAESAVMMYNVAGKVAFSGPWRFTIRPDAADRGKQKARWVSQPHDDHGVQPDTVHLQSAWVSCAEGCCNASSTG